MDKRINGSMAAAIVDVFCYFARILNLDENRVRLLVLAQFNVIYSIQGDMYQVGSSNPSGSDITVEINAIANSLVHRAAWYAVNGYTRKDFDAGKRFRLQNALVTFGDDFLKAHAMRISLPDLFAAYPRFGMDVTDGQKLAVPIYRYLTECSFLKRGFYPEDRRVKCGLDVKSILRMLLSTSPRSSRRKSRTRSA